jgi:tetratricopeptide (TPR) repeat protein
MKADPERLRDSKVFCLAPWTHLHVLATGEIFPCCMSAHEPRNAVGQLKDGDRLATAWNSEKMRDLRRKMLNGEASALCERCYQTEAVGQQSWRMSANQEFAHHFEVVQTTDQSGRVEKINLPYLDIRFSNVCNLRCRICGPKLSSSWYKDGLAMGWVSRSESAVETASESLEALWEQIVPLLEGAEHFHFAGGEPLVTEEHYRILDELLRRKLHRVKLSYNTNFSRLHYRSWDILELWRQFPNVYLQASLDGTGARGDYMRKGEVWEQIVENRERARRECPHIDFVVLSTVSMMNVLHMPDFYKEWLERGYIGPSGMQLNILFEPLFLNIRGLPASFKERVREKYLDFIDDYLGPLGAEGKTARTHFESVLLYMGAEDGDRLDEFRQYTTDLDVLRGERFQEVFPELAELVAPSPSVHWFHRGRAHLKFGRDELALRDFETVIDEISAESAEGRSPDRHTMLSQAYIEKGRLKLDLGDVEDARRDFDRARRIIPSLTEDDLEGGPREHARRAERMRARGDWDGATDEFTRAVELAPMQSLSHIDRLMAIARDGVFELLPGGGQREERDMFSTLAFGHYLRGVANQQLGDHQAAARDFTKALEGEPSFPFVDRARRRLPPS